VGILAQRLIRTLCPNCKTAHPITETERGFIERQYGTEYLEELALPDELYRANGCDACGDSGYKGRTGIHELLGMTPALRALIYQQASLQAMHAQAMQDGMRTLLQDGIRKLLAGDTDFKQIQMLGETE
jgi:type II secretory ATPase GspE/PulE/Tfp pilus assembly ATPase PilB-like protein